MNATPFFPALRAQLAAQGQRAFHALRQLDFPPLLQQRRQLLPPELLAGTAHQTGQTVPLHNSPFVSFSFPGFIEPVSQGGAVAPLQPLRDWASMVNVVSCRNHLASANLPGSLFGRLGHQPALFLPTPFLALATSRMHRMARRDNPKKNIRVERIHSVGRRKAALSRRVPKPSVFWRQSLLTATGQTHPNG